MTRILLATVAAVSFAGIAAAQEPPMLQGNYDASVVDSGAQSNTYNGNAARSDRDVTIGTRAIAIQRDRSPVGGYTAQDRRFDYSGR